MDASSPTVINIGGTSVDLKCSPLDDSTGQCVFVNAEITPIVLPDGSTLTAQRIGIAFEHGRMSEGFMMQGGNAVVTTDGWSAEGNAHAMALGKDR